MFNYLLLDNGDSNAGFTKTSSNAAQVTTAAGNGVRPFRRVRKTAYTLPVKTKQEECTPWTPNYLWAEFDLACTRTTVFMCKYPDLCGETDPRLDVLEEVWMVRKFSSPRLTNVPTLPVADCIEWNSVDVSYDDFWYSGVRDGVVQASYETSFGNEDVYYAIGFHRNWDENNLRLSVD